MNSKMPDTLADQSLAVSEYIIQEDSQLIISMASDAIIRPLDSGVALGPDNPLGNQNQASPQMISSFTKLGSVHMPDKDNTSRGHEQTPLHTKFQSIRLSTQERYPRGSLLQGRGFDMEEADAHHNEPNIIHNESDLSSNDDNADKEDGSQISSQLDDMTNQSLLSNEELKLEAHPHQMVQRSKKRKLNQAFPRAEYRQKHVSQIEDEQVYQAAKQATSYINTNRQHPPIRPLIPVPQKRKTLVPMASTRGPASSINGGPINIDVAELAPYVKSKRNLYNILSNEGQLYLPSFLDCTMEFMRELLAGKKKVFTNEEIRVIRVPAFEELTAKSILQQVKGIPIFQLYLPDLNNPRRTISREYLFNIINTVDPRFFRENIRHAYRERKTKQLESNKKACEISPFMFDLITSSNQIVTGKAGRALALLKSCTKKRAPHQVHSSRQRFAPYTELNESNSTIRINIRDDADRKDNRIASNPQMNQGSSLQQDNEISEQPSAKRFKPNPTSRQPFSYQPSYVLPQMADIEGLPPKRNLLFPDKQKAAERPTQADQMSASFNVVDQSTINDESQQHQSPEHQTSFPANVSTRPRRLL